jgi:phosphatidate phosphatase APP1
MPGSAADPAGASFDALGNLSSDLGRDENLVLFATAAHRSPGGDGWVVPVHGRIFRPPDGRTAKAALALALKTGFGVSPDDINRSRFDERCALMLGDNRAGRRIVITIAGANHLLSPSDRYGHFRGILPVPDAAVATVAAAGYIPIAVRLGARDHRHFEGRALMIAERGVSIISDIDDTVKVTHVASRRRMMAQTFLEAFEAVAGMAERYRGWVSEGAALHFISSSPWPLYEPLDAFLTSEGFPPSTKTLKNVALKDRSIRNLLAKATKTKPPAIDALLTAFPERRFILVGDSAENDAEIYADAARRHPGRVDRIFIRDCGSRRGGLERARRVLSGLEPNSWLIFDRAEDLPVSIS